MKAYRVFGAATICASLAFGVTACGDDDSSSSSSKSDKPALSGTIKIDGSSTVFPFAQAAAEQFREENPKVNVTVGESGTGGGFEKFCADEIDIANASREIEDDEVQACKKTGVAYGDVQVANDGIAVATNPELKIECLTTAQLKTLWINDKVKDYAKLGDGIAAGEVTLFGPGTDSGTFDFFTEAINGEKGETRKDYTPSEDDNVLVQGLTGSKSGLGYFGFSYYEANQDKLNLVQIDAGDGCKAPSKESVQDGSYKPLSRPLFMYPSSAALKRPEVKAFVEFVNENQEQIADAANIVPLTEDQAADAKVQVQEAEKAAAA